jgi:hypothetical protein
MIPAEDEVFLAAVLAVATRARLNKQSVEQVADAYLAEAVDLPRAGLIHCASEVLRLMADLALVGAPPTDFPDMVRHLARSGVRQGETVVQRTLRLLDQAYRCYRQISMAFRAKSALTTGGDR